MKCQAHNTDGCPECCPAMRAAWTARQLKAALAGLPDDTPLAVNVVDITDPHVVDGQVIVGAGFGTVNWGDGYGPEPGKIFGLECEIPERQLETRPERPPRLRSPHRPLSPHRGLETGHGSAPIREPEPHPDPEAG
jgi:hypothetical protein